MVAWLPAPFPQLVSDIGFQESPPETRLRTQMDAGPAKVRNRFTAGVRPIGAQLDVTEAEVEQFDLYYRNDLANGTLRIDWVTPRTQVSAELRIVGAPVYQFVGGDVWRIVLSLEVMP